MPKNYKKTYPFIMKTLFVINLLLLLITSTNAQQSTDIELGIGMGLNIANVLRVDGERNTSSSRISFNSSISGEYYFSESWGFKAKLIYDSKGWSDGFLIRTDENSENITTDIKLNYITIPLMANWHFGNNRNWNLNFGPFLGVLVSARDSKFNSNLKSELNSTDFGLAFGIGHKFKINDHLKFYIEYDGQIGSMNIFEEDFNNNIRNIRSSLNIGILLDY